MYLSYSIEIFVANNKWLQSKMMCFEFTAVRDTQLLSSLTLEGIQYLARWILKGKKIPFQC